MRTYIGKKIQVSHRFYIAVEMVQPSNYHKPLNQGFQNYVCGRSSQNHWVLPNGAPKFHTWQQQRPHSKPHNLELADPTKTMSLAKWSSKISSAAGSSRLQTWQSEYESSVTGRLSKDHEPYKIKFQNFIRGRSSQDHNLTIWSTKFCLAGPAKTMSLTLAKWSSKILFAAGPVKTTNLAIWSTRIRSGSRSAYSVSCSSGFLLTSHNPWRRQSSSCPPRGFWKIYLGDFGYFSLPHESLLLR